MYSYYSIWFGGVSTATSDLLSIDFLINRFLWNYKKTSNTNLVKYCRECFFSFDMPSDLWRKRATKFESKFTDFYTKVQLSFFSFLFQVVCLFCCILCLLYIMLLLPCRERRQSHKWIWLTSKIYDWRRRLSHMQMTDSDFTVNDWRLEHSNSGKKVSIRFNSIRQSDKFAACTLIFK